MSKKTSNDYLQKSPPSAIDIEESVLGAIIIEGNNARVPKILKLLLPDHFYLEKHQVIYTAIAKLNTDGKPIDLRSVPHQLRSMNRLEEVGGSYYIAELTSKVSSSANIEYHTQILIQEYLKRSVIQISQSISSTAYDPNSDPLELIPATIQRLQYLFDRSVQQTIEQSIKDQWNKFLVTEKPPEVQPLITIQNKPVATPGGICLLTGKKKSRKSLLVTWLINEMFTHQYIDPRSVLLFDTEQEKSDVWSYQDRIFRLSGKKVPTFTLRELGASERLKFINSTCLYWPTPIKLIIIDGIRDLLIDFNNITECSDLITWLLNKTSDGVHIMPILHLNKTDGNPRGHLGSELQNKAESNIEVEYDTKTGVSLVKCESSRKKPFETFAFTHSKDDLPILVDAPVDGIPIPDDERRKILSFIFQDGPLKYSELKEEIKNHFSVGLTRAEHMIREFHRNYWIVKEGKERSPSAVYRLVASDVQPSDNGHSPPNDPPPPTEDGSLPF